MAFHPNIADRKEIEAFLAMMLEAYKQGRAEREVIVGILATAIMAAAQDNQGAFSSQVRKSEKEHFAADAS
jgi:hypothetical protein